MVEPEEEEKIEAPDPEIEFEIEAPVPEEEPAEEKPSKEFLRQKTKELKDNYMKMKFRRVNSLNIFDVKKEFEESKKVCAYYRNKKDLDKKIMRMVKDGKENMQILSDFDKTITPFSFLGTYCSATMGIFSGCNSISQQFQKD